LPHVIDGERRNRCIGSRVLERSMTRS
jgi:hypothetical protein